MRLSTLSRSAVVGLALALLAGSLCAQSAPNLVHFQARLASNIDGR
jgi:hypothetical protein